MYEFLTDSENAYFEVDDYAHRKIAYVIAKNHKKQFNDLGIDIECFNPELQLFDYQKVHASTLLNALSRSDAALDASDTGTGKTYSAFYIAKQLNINTFVICPKSIRSTWLKLSKAFNIPITCVNYEKLRKGNTAFVDKHCEWSLEGKWLLIFDEVHRCKNKDSLNSKLLVNAKRRNYQILMLSATVADNPLQLYGVGTCINLFENYYKFIYNNGCSKVSYMGHPHFEFHGSASVLVKLHNEIFPEHGSRVSIKDLGDIFKENIVESLTYDTENATKIDRLYKEMHEALEKIEHKKFVDTITKANVLARLIHIRQEIEMLKIPIFQEVAEDALEEGNSIVIFLNFTDSVNELAMRLGTTGIINGEHVKDREETVRKFQADEIRVVVCNIGAGSESISLHDLHGDHPRVSLLSPSWSAQSMKQALGRIHRAKAMTLAVQKIIFCANTYEETICKRVALKIRNIDLLNDGDLK